MGGTILIFVLSISLEAGSNNRYIATCFYELAYSAEARLLTKLQDSPLIITLSLASLTQLHMRALITTLHIGRTDLERRLGVL